MSTKKKVLIGFGIFLVAVGILWTLKYFFFSGDKNKL